MQYSRDMQRIIDTNKAAGKHFFDPATLRYFSSRIHDVVYTGAGGTFIVTSERDTMGRDVRFYTVREVIEGGARISTFGTHGVHATRKAAHEMARYASFTRPTDRYDLAEGV